MKKKEKKKERAVSYLERAKQQYPDVPLFKQQIIAKLLKLQDEIRQLEKRYGKGFPLGF